MTVCIAILPRFTDKIVLVSDMLLSSDEASADGTMKFATIGPFTEWYVMFAGDPSRFLTLMDAVRGVLGDVKNTRLTLSTVTAAFEQAYCLEMLRVIESDILQPYGLAHEELILKGKDLLGEIRFNQVMDRVEAVDLGVEVLVAGLDAFAQTQLFSVSSRGIVSRAALPYHAIGAGAPIALGSLYPLSYFPMLDLAETVYRACAAKFAAENARSVGESTYAVVISPLAHAWTLVNEIDQLREIWKAKGQPPVPPGARRLIERDLRRIQAGIGRKSRARGAR